MGLKLVSVQEVNGEKRYLFKRYGRKSGTCSRGRRVKRVSIQEVDG